MGRHQADAANKPRSVPRANDRRVLNGILVPDFGIIEEYP